MTIRDQDNMSFICFGGEDWWYHNRGHFDMQLMRKFARLGPALYVNSIVMQKPNLKKNTGGGASFAQKLFRKTRSILAGLKKSSEAGFWVYSPLALPVHHISGVKRLNEILLNYQIRRVANKLRLDNPLIWVVCPAACEIAIKSRRSFLVYQRTDRYEEYPNVDSGAIRAYDRELKASADLTVFVNQKLLDEEADQCRRSLYLDHGVDYEIFSTAERTEHKPADIAAIPKPIVGFFGGIDDHTSDIALLEKVAGLLPEMSFVLVGKASASVSGLQQRKNVWLLGQKPYEQIPHYGKCFNVAIMPWRQNRWIRACNPIKLKEYLALGKPIVSTPFPELDKYLDLIYLAATPEEFARSIQAAVAEDDDTRVAARRQRVAQSSWESKAELVLREVSTQQ
ncbi:MAG: glycosyltransferase [Phycisphaerales bacterium]|nr:MAG: glycosyltransferase [Phycisphaerales bacterium]